MIRTIRARYTALRMKQHWNAWNQATRTGEHCMALVHMRAWINSYIKYESLTLGG